MRREMPEDVKRAIELGKKAEYVANDALQAARIYMSAEVPVGPYLADQLLLPMGLAAQSGRPCSFRTMPLTKHIDVLQEFLDVSITVKTHDDGSCVVGLR